jgi:uncharacterized protein (TIGR02246 family)
MMLGGAAARAAPAGADEQAVTAAEQQWLKSQQANDVELLAPLLADKVVETTEEGKVLTGKDAVLAESKSVTWSSVDYSDLKVSVFGLTAIATGTFTGKGKDATGKALDDRSRFTDTWLKMDGKWLCIATQESPLGK